MTVKERLIEFIGTTKLNISAFQKYCELPNGYVNNMRKSLGPESVKKIKSKYPELNEIWLLHGQGEMLIIPNQGSNEIPNISEKDLPALSIIYANAHKTLAESHKELTLTHKAVVATNTELMGIVKFYFNINFGVGKEKHLTLDGVLNDQKSKKTVK